MERRFFFFLAMLDIKMYLEVIGLLPLDLPGAVAIASIPPALLMFTPKAMMQINAGGNRDGIDSQAHLDIGRSARRADLLPEFPETGAAACLGSRSRPPYPEKRFYGFRHRS
jgi:hypothetical protein